MNMLGRYLVITVGIVSASLVSPPDLEAQAPFIDVGLQQSFTSSAALRTPLGVSAALGVLGLWGPMGVEVSYRDVSEGGGPIGQPCDIAQCPEGGFVDRSLSLRTLGVGISYDIENPTDVMLTLGLHGALNRQTEHLTDIDTGVRSSVTGTDSDFSFGLSADLRLRPVVSRLRPAFTFRYDRVSTITCAADAACFGGRNVWGLSAGISWVLRAKR